MLNCREIARTIATEELAARPWRERLAVRFQHRRPRLDAPRGERDILRHNHIARAAALRDPLVRLIRACIDENAFNQRVRRGP